jgi:Tol biopolymer transport system component
MTDDRWKGCFTLSFLFTILAIGAASVLVMNWNRLIKEAGSMVEHDQVSISVDPRGELLAFTSADGGLFTLSLGDFKVRQLQDEWISAYGPAFSPNGKDILFASSIHGQHGRSLYRCSRDGGHAKRLTLDNKVSDSSPSYSPDGSKVAFFRASRYRPYSMGGMVFDDYDVCLLDLKTNAVSQLTNQKYYQGSSVVFSPDGMDVLFTASLRDGPLAAQGYKVGINAGAVAKLDPAGPQDKAKGAWMSDLNGSSGSKMITFLADREQPYHYDIYVAGSGGELPRPLRVTKRTRYNQAPKFASDGQSIYYLAGTSRNIGSRAIYSLFRVDLQGRIEEIADSELFTHPTEWMGRSMSVYVP